MQIFIHRYNLTRSQKANTQTSNEVQSGALIKVVDESENFGVADLCPWPSLGDNNLEIEILSRGLLFQNTLRLAQLDLEARKNKISLNQGLIVKNHFLISDYKKDEVKSFYGATVKIKGDRNIVELAAFLNEQAKNFKKVRLDFNGVLDISTYEKFVSLLNPSTQEKIECIEDPYLENVVIQKNIPLAADFVKSPVWPHKIIKPARTRVPQSFLYLTSVMDHPIGVAHGMIEAQKYPDKTHGFMTLGHYQPTAFQKYFKIHKDEMSYESDGYGIGFESELNALIWKPLKSFDEQSENQLFQPPGSHLHEIQNYFDQKISTRGYFLISSSGSSQQISSGLKVYAISIKNFINSARRVNQQYHLTSEMSWGCVLPTYHVGGLSILARAHLSKASVFITTWKNFSIDWILENKIQILSLVPTQLYDLVQKNIKCPDGIKYVFIGGAHLSSNVCQKAHALGWPLAITFGMTETSSMFARRELESEFYKPYDKVDIELSNNGLLKIKCDSLADYVLQKVNTEIVMKPVQVEGWYETEDFVELIHGKFKFKSRSHDQIKINGEGVSLLQLREKLENYILKMNLDVTAFALISLPNERAGEQIVLVSTVSGQKRVEELYEHFNFSVLPHEKIKKIIILRDQIPMNEMNKIKYSELKKIVLKEQYEST